MVNKEERYLRSLASRSPVDREQLRFEFGSTGVKWSTSLASTCSSVVGQQAWAITQSRECVRVYSVYTVQWVYSTSCTRTILISWQLRCYGCTRVFCWSRVGYVVPLFTAAEIPRNSQGFLTTYIRSIVSFSLYLIKHNNQSIRTL